MKRPLHPSSSSSSSSSEPAPPLVLPPTSLPICSYESRIKALLKSHPALVLTSSTGSGKTTYLPSYALSSLPGPGGVACTQPRRVACTSVASYVASRVGCAVGDGVGYNVRFDRKAGPSTLITYLTDGMLLRDACTSSEASRLLSRYKCVVIDEAHERSLATDVIIPIVKQAMLARNYDRNVKSDADIEGQGSDVKKLRRMARKMKAPKLRVVVMSATISTGLFAEYFGAEVLAVPGRTHRVDVCYLKAPARDVVEACVEACARLHEAYGEGGDILCFLPGQEEILEAVAGIKKILERR